MSRARPSAIAAHRPLVSIGVLIAILALLLSPLGVVRPVLAVAVDAGYRDHSWSGYPGVDSPTQDKPQSKVWFTDGYWWGGLFANGAYRIHRYDTVRHRWTNTGVAVDQRDSSHGDYLWDEATNSLYVASSHGNSDANPIKVFKLNYDPATNSYSHDADFTAQGVEVGTGPSETVTIAKDSTGQLWVTFQNPNADPSLRDIMVNSSTTDEHVWGTPFDIAQADPDDLSAIIAFGGDSVGVMWSDQNPAENQTFFYFATHADSDADTNWSAKQASAQGTENFAEDHVNLKLVAAGSGEVLAAVKTDAGPHVHLLRRDASNGSWTKHEVVGALDVTRPQLAVDATNQLAYVFYTTPTLDGDGDQAIYYKSAPLATLDFAAGLGTSFIANAPNDINNVSTPKQPVTAAMAGIVAIASSDTNESYYHGFMKVDTTKPVANAPRQRLISNSTLGTSTIPVRISWKAASDADPSSGILRYKLQQRKKSGSTWGSWSTVATTARRAKTVKVAPGLYQFRLRAQDRAGNWSAWKAGRSFRLKDPQGGTAISFSGSWSTQNGSDFYDGSTRYTGARGRTAKHTFTGREVAFVAVRGPDRGRAKVFIDGVFVKRVDLYATSTQYRRVVFAKRWSSSSTHTIEIRVVWKNAASSSGRVDLDAFLTIR